MRKLRHERGSQAFACVDERIDEHELRQNREFGQRAPRIVSTTKNIIGVITILNIKPMCWLIDTAAKREASAGGENRRTTT